MKLESFTVERYRSITKAKRIKLKKTSVLVGPNNEGKSNLLRALVLAMTILTNRKYAPTPPWGRRTGLQSVSYDWGLDFPVDLQHSKPKGESVIVLDFHLTQEELRDFYREVGSRITGNLPLRIAISANGVKVAFHKKGPHSKELSKKAEKIADFLAKRIRFEYIPTVRTAEYAEEIISSMVARELEKLEIDEEYKDALDRLAKLQQPILQGLSESIQKTFKQFLPQVNSVEVRIRQEERYRALRRAAEIIVDDGIPTSLSYKGDGVQSLAALAIVRHSTDRGANGRSVIIAVEEPESHLHPNAIHELKQVLDDISATHQMILTTHNPLFVDRRTIGNNIVVQNNKARAATNIEEVRETLGVRAADNLRHAELVLIVEGGADKFALESLLRHYSQYLSNALNNGTLAIQALGGASNLSYHINLLRACICMHHVFLDHDKAALESFKRAESNGILDNRDTNFAKVGGLNESEFEDLFEEDLFAELIKNKYRVSVLSPKFKSKKKWSDRLKDCFDQHGKHWDEKTEVEIKTLVANAVATNPGTALNAHKKPVFDSLVSALETRLKEREKAQP
jgi:putative ATP-dependent endonuclease of OLD family